MLQVLRREYKNVCPKFPSTFLVNFNSIKGDSLEGVCSDGAFVSCCVALIKRYLRPQKD